MNNSVAQLENEIREIFNIPRRRAQFKWGDFVQACSALDVIGDTALALDDYRQDTAEYGQGITYILVYGVLQTLVLQQDAIKHLSKCLFGNEIQLPGELRDIRRIRVWASGHLTESGGKNEPKRFHHIARALMNKDAFRLSTTHELKQDFDFKDVSILTIIEVQLASAAKLLENFLKDLREDENNHRSKYMSDKLASIFHDSIGYHFGKVFQGIRAKSQSDQDLGRVDLEHIASCIHGFADGLKAREEMDIANDLRLKEAEYALEKVKAFFDGESRIDPRDAEVFLEHIENRVKILKVMAEEVDRDYETRV